MLQVRAEAAFQIACVQLLLDDRWKGWDGGKVSEHVHPSVKAECDVGKKCCLEQTYSKTDTAFCEDKYRCYGTVSVLQ
jgi:hypothetical protein